MNETQIVVVIVGIIVTGIAAYRAGQGRGYGSASAIHDFMYAVNLVSKFAPAADQLVKLGELQPDDRKDYVISMVLDTLKNIDYSQVEAILEAWVVESKQPKAGE